MRLVFVAVTFVVGCTGENLFTGPSLGSSLLGPTAEITAPAPNAVVASGDSVQVTANVASDNGVTEVVFSGVFNTGTAALVSQTVTLPSARDTTISRYLQRSGAATGAAKVIVQARDVVGATASDTVSVTLN
jgi:hypothetical protein